MSGESKVSGGDWLIGADRRALATRRIVSIATEMVARHGWDNFDIDGLAARAHCSRATIYRNVGGKAQIREAVFSVAGERITHAVREAVAPLEGSERLVVAILVALDRVRADPLSDDIVQSFRDTRLAESLIESPRLGLFAGELTGLTTGNPLAAQWIVRIFVSLLSFPASDPAVERRLLEDFVAPALTQRACRRLL
ncbi:TetR/AcrR family transcriptional regulator [Mycolicibacterium sp. 22603]|uniref:TetR/AcrR family transcriptional regulator n=1 Tax=Mycolicibacterium sp. 22603 TaxID=3453950 RepID=UPI003F8568E5